jgi:hypothetical protein
MRTLLVAAMFAIAGCMATEVDDVASRSGAATVLNGLTSNALTTNALTKNSLTKNSLTKNSLTKNALESTALVADALASDANARTLLHYVYSCAMPQGTDMTLTLAGTTYVFEGELGVAPAWGTGSCDLSCQRWVSACVLSRVNEYGTVVSIDVHGALPAIDGAAVYPNLDGAFFGNIFADRAEMFTCGPDTSSSNNQTCEDTRACTTAHNQCGFTYVGTCDTVCQPIGGRDDGYVNCIPPRETARAEVVTAYFEFAPTACPIGGDQKGGGGGQHR